MDINSAINSFVWGPVMLVLIVGVGIYFTAKSKFFQVSKIGMWMKGTIGLLFSGGRKKTDAGSVSPFQAFTTAMAATAGTGNLVGVTTALLLGGPGAVFWMWISGFFGMMTKYAEITLAVRYRKRNQNGDWVGGPMYYILDGLGPKAKPLAILFAVFGSLCAFGIGNMTQINSIVGTTYTMLEDVGLVQHGTHTEFSMLKLIMGIALAILVALVLLGGLQRIGEVTEFLVPFIGVACILGCIVAIIIKRDNLPAAVDAIFKGAFQMKAAGGGVLGFTISQAIRFGVARGVFTNEAGLGSAPIAHAAADVDHPVKQGLWGCFEVFADTLVMCTLSALVVLTSGVYEGTASVMDGSQMISAAFKASFGVGGSIFLAFSVLVFAYCTCLSWSLYGLRCFEFLTGGKAGKVYQGIYCLIVVLAAVAQLTLVWDIADTLNGLMAIPNLIALVGLAPVVFKLTHEYLDMRKKNSFK